MATQCPLESRQEFLDEAKPEQVTICGVEYELGPRINSSMSLGYNLNAKGYVTVKGKKCPVQIGLNITLIGSGRLDQ